MNTRIFGNSKQRNILAAQFLPLLPYLCSMTCTNLSLLQNTMPYFTEINESCRNNTYVRLKFPTRSEVAFYFIINRMKNPN